MRRLRVRAIQFVILALLAFVRPPAAAQGSELGCYLLCLMDDWICIAQTGHPAEACSYQAEEDICNLGGCWLLD